jgi:hypothetical protein
MKRTSLGLLWLCLALQSAPLQAKDAQLYISEGAWLEPLFLNLPLHLTSEYFSLRSPDGVESKVSADGGFTLYLKRDIFPIPMPASCEKDWLKVVMPGYRKDVDYATHRELLEHSTKEKQDLFAALQSVYTSRQGNVDVTVTFASDIVSKKPFTVKATACDLQFTTDMWSVYNANPGIPVERRKELFE